MLRVVRNLALYHPPVHPRGCRAATTVLKMVTSLLFVFLVPLASAAIPSYIHVCKRNDPKINECIMKSIEDLRPYLLKGIPELNVPAIEPLFLPEVVVAEGAGIKATGKMLKIYGPGEFNINKFSVNLDNPEVRINVDLPQLTFDGEYEVSGKLLLLPLVGKGPVKANATDCKGDVVLRAALVKKDGKEYLFFNDVEIDISIKNYYVHLYNLFKGDKLLGEATNTALNENSKELIAYLKPVVEETVANIILNIANNITNKFGYDELFPLA